ncbi:hypothetical protein EB796_000890 [Bugula neritina]|uniref:Uncharacterized protein n=1 Tax=Bugula neritina TaxID=10212 RepID=A0A7J7KRH8_BUGNE|nr:hypothetical protein EB796_000890 [Bugula neritina]
MALLLPSSTSSGTLHYSASGYEEVSPYCEGAVTATGDSIVQPLLSTPSQTGEQVEAVEPEVPEHYTIHYIVHTTWYTLHFTLHSIGATHYSNYTIGTTLYITQYRCYTLQ